MFVRPIWSGSSCLVAETYASLAAAESSGDDWCNGAEITITGGAVFIYFTVLAVDGYSGLIHKEPYGSGNGIISIPTLLGSHDSVDPDTWSAEWTDYSTGTKGVDYEFDTNAGHGKLNDITTGGRALMQVDSGDALLDKEMFSIADTVRAWPTSSGAFESAKFTIGAVKANDVDLVQNTIRVVNGTDGVYWLHNHGTSGGSDTPLSHPFNDVGRLWQYVKEGRSTVWVDGNATPDSNQTDPRTYTSNTNSSGSAVAGSTGRASNGLEVGSQVFGRMTTS